MLRHADHGGGASGAPPLPRETLEQPGAERVEFAHPAHVDGNRLGPAHVGGNAVDQGFELRRMRRGPGAAGGKLEPAVFKLGCQ